MAKLLRLENLGLFLLSLSLFSQLPFSWWLYPVLFLAPDLGMLGYLAGPRFGASAYNFTHHLGIAALLYAIGLVTGLPLLCLGGVIMLGHSGMDRVLGFGLKYPDSFQHTHLGWIGSGKGAGASAE
ncbi:MAG TPA: DUF4260 domain-containing protein [Anaerolineales bacterium]|nr:DUF4260 domain-containing protein [Anaerolineales bacterium]